MKKKLLLFLGILIIVVGVGIILFPIISQAYTSHQQKLLMQDVKSQIFASINEVNEENSENESSTVNQANPVESSSSDNAAGISSGTAAGSDTSPQSDSDDTPQLDTLTPQLLLNNHDEEETVSEAATDKSRLRGQTCLGIISIEKIDLLYAIVEGTSDYNIGVAIGHFNESAAIGAEGNCALAGHNGGTYGRYFGDIKKLKVGDEVVLTDLTGTEYTYNVTEIFTVEPTDLYVVQDLGIEGKFLTMVTCTQHGTMRLIVRAECTEEPVSMRHTK